MSQSSPRILASFVVACLLGSCFVPHDTRVVPSETMMPWLRAGETSRSELLQILGPPARQLESGRILMWEIGDDGYQPHRWHMWGRGPMSLVVVAGPERVERVSLVRWWE